MTTSIDGRGQRPTTPAPGDGPETASGDPDPTLARSSTSAADPGRRPVASALPFRRVNRPRHERLRPDGPALTEGQLWWAYGRREVDG